MAIKISPNNYINISKFISTRLNLNFKQTASKKVVHRECMRFSNLDKVKKGLSRRISNALIS